MSDILCT